MDQLTPVRCVHRGTHPAQDRNHALGVQLLLALQFLAKGRPLEEFHHQKGTSARVDTEIVHGDHVGMGKARCRSRLPPETLCCFWSTGQILADDLHRHGPFECRIRRLIDGTHTAAPTAPLKAIAARKLS